MQKHKPNFRKLPKLEKLAQRYVAKHAEPTYRCALCQDRGFVLATDSKGIVRSDRCTCDALKRRCEQAKKDRGRTDEPPEYSNPF